MLLKQEGFGSVTPLVYYFGYNSPRENVELYKLLTTIIADRVKRRLEKDLDAKASGVIINTCGWVDGAGYDAILHCAKAFEVDVLLVMGQDKLYSTLHSALSTGGKVIVVKLPRSGGVVTRVSVLN